MSRNSVFLDSCNLRFSFLLSFVFSSFVFRFLYFRFLYFRASSFDSCSLSTLVLFFFSRLSLFLSSGLVQKSKTLLTYFKKDIEDIADYTQEKRHLYGKKRRVIYIKKGGRCVSIPFNNITSVFSKRSSKARL